MGWTPPFQQPVITDTTNTTTTVAAAPRPDSGIHNMLAAARHTPSSQRDYSDRYSEPKAACLRLQRAFPGYFGWSGVEAVVVVGGAEWRQRCWCFGQGGMRFGWS